jgi:hypothetical protein
MLFVLMCAARAVAQDHDHMHNAVGEQWAWSVDGRVFFGYNFQDRKFTDFDEWESQNYVMLMGGRAFGPSQLHLVGMFSGELVTLRDIGSPQVFQTGETYQKAPLIDYQHPHDLFMTIGAEYSRSMGAVELLANAYLVGPAPLGPQSFMHRPSAAENPQTPLSHHFMDSTHITTGVVSGGVESKGLRLEGGWFRGREPDENRHDIDVGKLDSYSGRASFTRGAWSAQVSAAHLTVPETTSPYDEGRLTASVSYFKVNSEGSLAWMAAFGQNREFYGKFEAYLFEATWRHSKNGAAYTRLEEADKDILDAGFHPKGIAHTHRQSPVTAMTMGYVRDVVRGTRLGTLGIGADMTTYKVPANLKDSYGSPFSYHVYVRYHTP